MDNKEMEKKKMNPEELDRVAGGVTGTWSRWDTIEGAGPDRAALYTYCGELNAKYGYDIPYSQLTPEEKQRYDDLLYKAQVEAPHLY